MAARFGVAVGLGVGEGLGVFVGVSVMVAVGWGVSVGGGVDVGCTADILHADKMKVNINRPDNRAFTLFVFIFLLLIYRFGVFSAIGNILQLFTRQYKPFGHEFLISKISYSI